MSSGPITTEDRAERLAKALRRVLALADEGTGRNPSPILLRDAWDCCDDIRDEALRALSE